MIKLWNKHDDPEGRIDPDESNIFLLPQMLMDGSTDAGVGEPFHDLSSSI